MIKKQYIYLILLGGILAALIYFLQQAKDGDQNSTFKNKHSDFAIEDTNSIYKIIITDVNGDKATITKLGKDDWQLNGKYKARIDAVRIILKTAKLISVKSEVSVSAKKNVLKTMMVTFKKVEYYSKGMLLKTWYVGGPTRDHYGTYMLLEHSDGNRDTVPYITEIKGFFGTLNTRYFTDVKEWRDKVIYKLNPDQIKTVELKNNEQPEYGFKINIKGKNSFELLDAQNKKVNGFDTVSVRAYILNYRKIAFEGFNRGILNEKQEDSLRKAIPFAEFTVTDISGKSLKIKTYRKAALPDQVDLEGNAYQYDIERLFGILPTGEIIIMQYGTVDKIWRAILNFKNPE